MRDGFRELYENIHPENGVISPARNSGGPRWYWANTRGDACPNGSNTEQTIKEIWAADSAKK